MIQVGSKDLAGHDRWDSIWAGVQLPGPLDPHSPHASHFDKAFHRFFVDAFSHIETAGLKLLEVGCGNSRWLPYFAKEWGFEVTGLDYSEQGCLSARAILDRESLAGIIVQADMFDPPSDMLGDFDVVVSFGVVEHFDDTAVAIGAVAALAKVGGLVLTEVPNLDGFNGFMARVLDAENYRTHKVIGRSDMRKAYQSAGLSVGECSYLMSSNVYVWVPSLDDVAATHGALGALFVRLAVAIQRRIWRWEEARGPLHAGRTFSPYIVCVGVRQV